MRKNSTVIMLAFLMSGCSLVPDYARPTMNVSGQYAGADNVSPTQIAQDWWTTFNSDILDQMMDQALTHNNDLLAGIERMKQVRADVASTRASLFPSLDLSGSADKTMNNPTTGKTTYPTSLGTGASVAYEVDLFGANGATRAASAATLKSTEYTQDALALSVMGDVATQYFTLLNLHERLQIADTNLKNATEIERIIQARVVAGSESDLELAQQKASVASNAATRATLAQQINATENALAVLLGQIPQTSAIALQDLNALNVPGITPGQPSELLERRPDIRAAEANLIAANADIGKARAAYYPSLTLGVNTNLASTGLGDPVSTALGIATSLAQPIFHGGAIEAGVERANARQRELIETYRKTVLVAFQEVEDALTSVKTAATREDLLRVASEQATRAYQLSKRQYDAGSIDFQTLLDTQSTQLSATDTYSQAKLARLTAAVQLYKTLGGGWDSSKK